jgi:N-acetylglucosamine-6-phosphate deacetylase
MLELYGPSLLESVRIITLAPELDGIMDVIPQLKSHGIVVSVGHSSANIDTGIKAVKNGATLITRKCIVAGLVNQIPFIPHAYYIDLFNAMEQFHHRDPGLIGLLGANALARPFWSIIVDNIHSHAASVTMAFKSHPEGAIIITDAIEAMGLPPGHYRLGTMHVDITDRAKIAGTETLAGAIAPMDQLVRNFLNDTGCSIVEALEAATLHPAQVLGITERKGTLAVGADADLVLLDDQLQLQATFIAGQQTYTVNSPTFARYIEPCLNHQSKKRRTVSVPSYE